MEETSGVALLNRGARGVTPTPAGDALEHYARIVLAQMGHMRGDLQLFASGLRGQVRVLSGTSAMAHLPDALLRYLADYPAIDIKLEERQSFEIVEAVAAGVVDFGIGADTADTGSLETRPFAIDRLVLLVPIGHGTKLFCGHADLRLGRRHRPGLVFRPVVMSVKMAEAVRTWIQRGRVVRRCDPILKAG